MVMGTVKYVREVRSIFFKIPEKCAPPLAAPSPPKIFRHLRSWTIVPPPSHFSKKIVTALGASGSKKICLLFSFENYCSVPPCAVGGGFRSQNDFDYHAFFLLNFRLLVHKRTYR